MIYKTEQEKFWSAEFGHEYFQRTENNSKTLIASNLALFSRVLARMEKHPHSIIEFGANIGMNLVALKLLSPEAEVAAVEINKEATEQLKRNVSGVQIFNESILDFDSKKQYDFVLVKGVLIHINPDYLDSVYKLLFESSKRYILMAEYYNPSPVNLSYRGHSDKLFKRDFAGEFMKLYPVRLLDHGFIYRNDPIFPGDDINWFLMEKTV